MKLPITDQFLYDFLETTSEAGHVIFGRKKVFGDLLFFSESPFLKKYRMAKNRKIFNKLIYYLKKNNFIRVENLRGRQAMLLTKKGAEKAFKASFKIQDKNRRRDGKWIMIIYDIPQNRKRDRTLLRSILKNLGYKLFQQSVWINPYDIYKKTEEALQFYCLDKYVRIFLVDEV